MWGISVRKGNVKKTITCNSLEEAKSLALKIKEKCQDEGIVIDIFSRLKAFKPNGNVRKKRGEWWCPYCAELREFYFDTYLHEYRCPICSISEKDYYVRKYNRLWK